MPRIPTHAEARANPEILRRFNAAVVEEFESNGGRVGGPFADSHVLLLTMTGAKSGRRRRTPLEYFTVDGRMYIVGTRGGAPQHPAWVHNLRVNSAVRVEVGTQAYDVVADEITGDEREAIWAKMIERCPRIGTYPKPERVIPVFEPAKGVTPAVIRASPPVLIRGSPPVLIRGSPRCLNSRLAAVHPGVRCATA
ncbi:uncharacterized protein RMCC_6487 [Mycolicibacterium canariasense]|uniref:Deazaflavin-dependent nitroreductase family protein n=1 Tax=Mycolicibacterium canariasense TaxID=228230 RepID=A0A100WJN4_MYCCR|nr:uncharacterized protein RMCC_6487 [Mycolicibacterium canariasense]